jgi:hypothetical protein
MTASQATADPPQADGPGALRIIGLAAVGVGLAALAGAAFVLSYNGIHAFALQAGISARLARGYPLIFDVLLVVILAAVLFLRGAGLPSKVLAWACLLALLSAAAGADALHAAGRKLPAKDAAVTAAIVPWVLVLIAFALLLAMLRQARLRRLAGNRLTGRGQPPRRWEPQQRPPAPNLPLVPGFGPAEPAAAAARPVEPPPAAEAPPAEAPRLAVPRQLTAESAADTAGLRGRGRHSDNGTQAAELAIDAELAPDDPSSDETPVSAAAETMPGEPGPGLGRDQADGDDAGQKTGDTSDDPGDPDVDTAAADDTADPEMPVFHRMWSSPVPPAGE